MPERGSWVIGRGRFQENRVIPLLQRNNNVIVKEVSTVYVFEDRSIDCSNCSAVVTAVWRRGSVLGS